MPTNRTMCLKAGYWHIYTARRVVGTIPLLYVRSARPRLAFCLQVRRAAGLRLNPYGVTERDNSMLGMAHGRHVQV